MTPRLRGRAFPPLFLPSTHHWITFCSFLHSCDVVALNLFPSPKGRKMHKWVVEGGEAFPPHQLHPHGKGSISLTVQLEPQSHKDWGGGDVVVQGEKKKWWVHMKMSTHEPSCAAVFLFYNVDKSLSRWAGSSLVMLPFISSGLWKPTINNLMAPSSPAGDRWSRHTCLMMWHSFFVCVISLQILRRADKNGKYCRRGASSPPRQHNPACVKANGLSQWNSDHDCELARRYAFFSQRFPWKQENDHAHRGSVSGQ